MEKSIREIAYELNISKEAIYRKINYSLKKELMPHIIKRDRKTYISKIGQAIILQSLKREIDEAGKADQSDTVQESVNNFITENRDTDLRNYVFFLEKQIDLLQSLYNDEVSNNKQERETLYKLNQGLIDAFSREQHFRIVDKQLQLHQTADQIESTPRRKGFFKKLFVKTER